MSFKIYLLGQFKLQANHLPLDLPSRPAQSLLAYLALNAGITHRREKLANLLWPETSESNARSYLRQALWRIRKSLQSASLTCEDFLNISDISVTFDDHSDYWLDADMLLETVEAQPVEKMIATIRLYRGELLPGFYDEWIVLERERLQSAYHQKMNLLLESLIQSTQWDEALKWGEQWIRLGYSPEPAFRALMKAHAGMGNQTMVSATYQRCVDALDRELGLEPSPETRNLYEKIVREESKEFEPTQPIITDLASQQPRFLDEEEPQQIEVTIFVARQRELEDLDRFLDLALAGQGRVVFVTGEAGSGKTALIQEFNRRTQEKHPDLIVASGNCNAYTGIGDPYLPLREILGLLSGDVEARWAAGAMSREHALRLWNTLPLTAQALLENGPDLIDTFIPGSALLERASLYPPGGADWFSRLDDLVNRKASVPAAPSLKQSDLFEQYTRLLQSLARSAPLILVVDDLQWADLGSISLLFHLGRHLAGSRILLLGAYRPEEVAIGRGGERHPLEPLVREFQRLFGDLIVDVDQAESREFMEALLDGEPNRLEPPFRQMLFEQTRGQPLFTIELLRGMQERGDLVQDQGGFWVTGPALDWDTLPARVEAVVAERISRLAQPLQAALRVASVEGESFTAEVIARVQGTTEREVVGLLSNELDRRHRLIHSQAIDILGSQRVSRYRFRHILAQKYLYDNLDEAERAYLHEDIGGVLEELHADQANKIAVQLAWHFQEAGISQKAIEYLHQAGDKAVQLSAYQEGITHLTKGLTMLMTQPDSHERAQQELTLQLALGRAWVGPKAYGPEVKKIYTRARELCQQLGKTHQLCQVLGQLAVLHFVQAELHRARELAEEALSLAQQDNDPLLVALGHWYLGFVGFFLGEYTTAQAHFKHVIGFYRPEQHHHSLVLLRGSDAGISALAYDALCLWCLGYPDQALRKSQEVLTLARELEHPFSLADALYFAGCLFNVMRRDWQLLKDYAEEQERLSHEFGLAGWSETATCFHGDAVAMLGQVKEGMVEMREGMVACQSVGVLLVIILTLGNLAKAQAKAGQPEKGLTTLAKAFTRVEQTDERYWEAELHRLRGEILFMQGDEDEAEASFEKAIEVARQQSAKSWELRAATGLARLWHKQGKTDEALQLLGEIYDWFTEGFDTPDLREAQALLEAMP
jgi:DNA-binding SARP family transcriptional activator/predicted ATPase